MEDSEGSNPLLACKVQTGKHKIRQISIALIFSTKYAITLLLKKDCN